MPQARRPTPAKPGANAPKNVKIPDETIVDPKEQAKLEKSIYGLEQAPTVAEQTPDFNTWQRMRDVLGPPFDNERVTLNQMRQLRKDPMIGFGLHYIKVPIARSEWHIDARDKNGVNAQVAAFVDACIRIIWARYVFQRMLCLDFGFQAMVKRWVIANPGGVYVDPLEENVENQVKPIWDEGSVAPKIWKAPVPLRPERVQPTFDDKTGEFTGMLYDVPPAQRGKSGGFKAGSKKKNQGQREIDVYHALWATNQKDDELGSIYGYPRTGYARDYWWDYKFTQGLHRRALERIAIPPVLAFHPEGSTLVDPESGAKQANWEIALEMAERLRSNAVAAVPSTMAEAGIGEASGTQRAWDFKYMEVPTDSLTVFSEARNYFNIMKLRGMWVPELAFVANQSGGNSGGNIAEQMAQIFTESQQLLMEETMDEVNRFMIPQLLWLNFPDFVNNGGTARMKTHGFRKEDVEMYKQIVQLIGQADPTALAQVDTRELLSRINLPLLTPAAYQAIRNEMANANPGGPPLVPGVTIRNPNVNPGATNGGSQPEPAGSDQAALGFSQPQQEFVYVQPVGGGFVGFGDQIDLAEADDFLSGLPTSKHYSDKTLRALSLQLRRLWAGHFKRLYPDIAKFINGVEKFEFADEDGTMLSFNGNGIEFADIKKAAAAAAIGAKVTKKQAEKAAKKILDSYTVNAKLLEDLAQKSAVIMRKMMKRAASIDRKNFRLSGDIEEDEYDTFLSEQTGRLIKFAHKTVQDELRGYLVDEIRSGSTSREIADSLVQRFDAMPLSKAERIARSETRDAVNAATLISSEAAGVKYVKQTDGEDFDEECRKRNGTLATVKEAWRNLRKEHPYGTLAFDPVPRAEFSIEFEDEPFEDDGGNERFAYFDNETCTAYVLRNTDPDMADAFLCSVADKLVKDVHRVEEVA